MDERIPRAVKIKVSTKGVKYWEIEAPSVDEAIEIDDKLEAKYAESNKIARARGSDE